MTSGFLTKRLSESEEALPFEDYDPAIKGIVLQAIRSAWKELVAHDPVEILGYNESKITACLERSLNDMRVETSMSPTGFSGSLFETVSRDASVCNYNGTLLEKKPDLVFRLRDHQSGVRGSQDRGIFVECKIVDRSHSIRDYCQKGLERFVKGEYAWAMPAAVMIGYARDGKSVPDDLEPYLEKHQPKDDQQYRTIELPTEWESNEEVEPLAYVSIHGRVWTYPRGGLPGDIQILHLWLRLRSGEN